MTTESMKRCMLMAVLAALVGWAPWTGSPVLGEGWGGEGSVRQDRATGKGRFGGDDIDDLLSAVDVDQPVSYRELTLFPVILRRGASGFSPVTFDEAIRGGDFLVEEIGSGIVNTVKVNNRGRRPVFIMAGEVMSGSKQDRIAQRDVLVPPKSGWIEVPVYCVEAGRWKVKTPRFGSRGAMAGPSLRSKAYAGRDQKTIWSEVDSTARAQGVAQSPGRALQEIYDDKEVREKLDEYMSGLKVPRNADMVGFVAYSGPRVIGADLFASPDLFERLRSKLLRSYVLSGGPLLWFRRPGPQGQEAARFLAHAWSEHCQRVALPTCGMGQGYRLENHREATGGGALIYRGDVIHLSLFPGQSAPGPMPVPMPDTIPIPR